MILRKQSATATRAAFTLMEMLVVVAILVVLAGAAVPIYLSYLDGARRDRVRIDIKTIEGAVDAYYMTHNTYPEHLKVLTLPQNGIRAAFDEKALLDPWNREYILDISQMHPTTGRPRIYTLGPAGDQSTMISNW